MDQKRNCRLQIADCRLKFKSAICNLQSAIMLIGLSLALSSGVLLFANPNRDHKPPGPPVSHPEADDYATQLLEISQVIVAKYIRPISREDLLSAALGGVYEAARVPLPHSLAPEVRKAAASEDELRKYLARTRQRLGNPESLRGPLAVQVSLAGMVQALDPYCAVLIGPALERLNSMDRHYGTGLELVDSSGIGPMIIKSVAPGSPAQRAGLRPGDQITALDGRSLNAYFSRSTDRVPTDPIRLGVSRPAWRMARTMTIKPENYHAETVLGVSRREDNSWDYFLDAEHKIAHVSISALERDTSEELAQVLTELRTARLRGLILDLRWCPGGFLDESRDVADLFLGDTNSAFLMQPTPANLLPAVLGNLNAHSRNATVWHRDGEPDSRRHRGYGNFVQFPIVVLVNEETVGGAELIAAVLQDNKRALISGQRTRGKASVQIVLPLDVRNDRLPLKVPVPKTGLKVSYGLLIRPSGKNLNRFPDSTPADEWGVSPDPRLEFRISADLSRQLKALWQLQDLRPAWDRDILPLDDPAADPQRQAALQYLLQVLR